MPTIQFPIDPRLILDQIENCKTMTYQTFAEINHCSIQEVYTICESQSGCTHYDIVKDRYLVLFNSSTDNNNVAGRIRWTLAHELGHIILKHLLYVADKKIAERNFRNLSNPELESEADYFASLLLAPMPLYKQLSIQTAKDIQTTFGLSCEAAECRWRDYLRWTRNHTKTAWENDLKRIYQS
jgi:Zn-dependent peptidase ImmA (M78 family)